MFSRLTSLFTRRTTRRQSDLALVVDESLCQTCSGVNLRHILRTAVPKDQSIELGLLVDILDKADRCPLCRLVATAFQESWFQIKEPSEIDLSGITCGLFAKGHDRARDPRATPPTEEEECWGLGIQHSPRPKEVSAMLSATRCRLTLGIQLMEEDAKLFNIPKDFHGRRVGDTVDLQLVKKWIRLCIDEHDEICQGAWWIDRNTRLPATVRMIDIVNMCLVPASEAPRYLALSYVWGGVGGEYQTLQDNVDKRLLPGGMEISTLPATILDSIQVCRQLGERYLWVDALCIVQDSPQDKAIQIGVMDRIYGASYLTIFAVGGNNAHAGLPGLRQGTRKNHQRIEIVQNLSLAVPVPDLVNVLFRSVWGQRGWTYQEAMLSCRRLYFTEHQVYFECLREVWSEDIVSGYHRSSEPRQGLQLSGMGNLTTPRAPRFAWQKTDYTNRYMLIVNQYGPRDFTNELDGVDGFSAITTTLTKAFELGPNGFRYGMLLTDLDRTLLWAPMDNVAHVRRYIPQDAPWPSWAWVGWRGAAEYMTKCSAAKTIPSVSGSVVKSWYLYESGTLVKLDSQQRGGLVDKDIPRYSPPRGPVELQEDVILPEGTLVFRATSASFKVGERDAIRSPSVADACNGVFILQSSQGSSPAGRIYLPYLPASNFLPVVDQVELVALARVTGEIGLCGAEDSHSQKNFFLSVMAVQTVHRQGYDTVVERLGIGLVSEGAWLNSEPQERVVFLA